MKISRIFSLVMAVLFVASSASAMMNTGSGRPPRGGIDGPGNNGECQKFGWMFC